MKRTQYMKIGRVAKVNYGGDKPEGANLPRGGITVTALERLGGTSWKVQDASGNTYSCPSRYLEIKEVPAKPAKARAAA